MRAAVLKMKDPRQIIRDMEKLDEMGEDNSYHIYNNLIMFSVLICI